MLRPSVVRYNKIKARTTLVGVNGESVKYSCPNKHFWLDF